jgi:hypothetical protein
MATSFGALCSDFYINQKIVLKLDLPTGRETVLHLFDRVRRELPQMDRFRRLEGEISLESPEHDDQYSWFALTHTAIRSGWVNPDSLEQAYKLHRLIVEISPYFLSISPIDVDYVELVYGFDLDAEANRNEIVFDALLGHSALAGLVDHHHESILESEPFIGVCLNERCDLQAFVEVKTRTRSTEIATGRFDQQPISVYLTVRRYGPLRVIEDFSATFATLAEHIERFAEQRLVPHVITPIREAIISRPS